MTNSYTMERRVEFCETDAAGIAHFSSLFQYMEQAEHGFLRSLGLSVFTQSGETVTWPRVHVEADFLGPARFEDVLSISVRILRLGNSSVHYGFEITSPRGAVAQGETVAVCCRVHGQTLPNPGELSGPSHGSLEKVKIPDDIRKLFLSYVVTEAQ